MPDGLPLPVPWPLIGALDRIYLSSGTRPFDEDRFIEDVQRLLKTKSGIVVVAVKGFVIRMVNPLLSLYLKPIGPRTLGMSVHTWPIWLFNGWGIRPEEKSRDFWAGHPSHGKVQWTAGKHS